MATAAVGSDVRRVAISGDSIHLTKDSKATMLWRNFSKTMESLMRKPQTFINFLKSEAGLESSMDKNDALRVQCRGREGELKERLLTLLINFVATYVTCRVCSSHD